MDKEHEALIEEAMWAQRQCMFALQMAMLPAWLELDISMAQLKALFTLAVSKGSTVSQLAELLETGRSATSLLIDRMVHGELVERSEDAGDRRRTLICLSPHGAELVAQLVQMRTAHRAWLEKLKEEDLKALIQGVTALAKEVMAAPALVSLRRDLAGSKLYQFN